MSGNAVLVSEERVFHTGLRVQANSLRGREGRGKLPGWSRSGQCVRVIKVNLMDGDWEGQRACTPSSVTQVLIEGQSSYGRDVGAALRHRWPLQGQGGWEALRLEAIIITAIIQSNHTSTPFGEITQASQNAPMKSLAIKEARTFPQTHGHSSHSSVRVLSPVAEGIKAALLRMLCRARPVSLEKPAF